jgi:hypothetical protein
MARSAPTPSERRVFWQAHLARWRESGQSQAAYCRAHELSAAQFRWWKRTLGVNGVEPPPAEPVPAVTAAFVPVHLAPASPVPPPCASPVRAASGVTLQWRELRIELALGFDRSTLRAVLHTLES